MFHRHKRPCVALPAILAIAAFSAPARATDKLEEQKLVASDAKSGDEARQTAISGDLLVIGAPGESSAGSSAGAAYVHENVNGAWVEVAKLTAVDSASGDVFGFAVAISGETIAVGAPFDDDAGSSSGAIYVFERVGGQFVQTQKLVASDAAAGDQLGFAVAIAGDVIVSGATGDDDNGGFSGSTYFFERTGGLFSEAVKRSASDGAAGDSFGSAVGISGDLAVVGALGDDDGGSGSGSAYVLERQGSTWVEVAKVVAGDASAGDQFGFSAAVDGDLVVVGAPRKDGIGGNSGAAYLFERQGSAFPQVAQLAALDEAAGDNFGFAVSVSGELIAVGAPSKGGAVAAFDQGAAYLFEREGNLFPQIAKLAASDAGVDAFGGDRLGERVSVSGDLIVASAPDADDVGPQSSASYVFDRRVLPGAGGCPGGSGVVPVFHVRGHPEVGNQVRIEVRGGVPSSVGVLFASPTGGSVGIGGCELLLDPQGLVAVAFPLDGAGALDAIATLPPTSQGASLTSQVLLHDASVAPAVAGSNSILISIDQ